MIVAPSIAAANQLYLAKEIDKVALHYQHLHIDIEDGNFVPNITFGMKLVNQICEYTKLSISLQFMTSNPTIWIEQLLHRVDTIYVNVENLLYPSEVINCIKNKGIKPGLAFNPVTSFESFHYLFSQINGILIMTSEPDGQGQLFLPEIVEKAKKAKEKGLNVWVDGGIKLNQLSLFQESNIDGVVIGRSFFENEKYLT